MKNSKEIFGKICIQTETFDRPSDLYDQHHIMTIVFINYFSQNFDSYTLILIANKDF